MCSGKKSMAVESAPKRAFRQYLEATIDRLEREMPSPADLQRSVMPTVVTRIMKMLRESPAPPPVANGVEDIFKTRKIRPGCTATWEEFRDALLEVRDFVLLPPPALAAEPVEAAPAAAVSESRTPARVEARPMAEASTGSAGAPQTLRPRFSAHGTEHLNFVSGHPLRGVSVTYLCTVLTQEVYAKGFTRDSKVYEIEPDVIRGKGVDVTCPRDNRPGAAYVDCLTEQDAALSTHMLSYTWGYTIGDICDSLLAYCEGRKLNPATTFFWICCLCINQHRVKEATARHEMVPFEQFKDEFGFRVQSIGRVVALMSPWKDPQYTKRVWCDFEMYTAASMGDDVCDISVTMPPREAEDMRKTLMQGGATIPELWEALQKVKIEDAQATVFEDKERIFRLIETGIGFHSLNSLVARCLQKWIVTACKEELQHQIEQQGETEEGKKDIAHLCAGVSYVLREVGHRNKAHSLMEEAIGWFRKAEIMNTKECAILMSHYGASQRYMGNLEGAFVAYKEALDVFKATGSLKSPEGAMLYKSLGAAERAAQNFVAAFDCYHDAEDIFEEIGMTHTTEYAMLFNSRGALYRQMGEPKKALDDFEKALGVLDSINALHTPAGTILMNSIALVKRQNRNKRGALAAYETALQIMERIGTIETESGERVLSTIGGLRRTMKDFDGAVTALRVAVRIRVKMETLHTEDGIRLQQRLEETELLLAAPTASCGHLKSGDATDSKGSAKGSRSDSSWRDAAGKGNGIDSTIRGTRTWSKGSGKDAGKEGGARRFSGSWSSGSQKVVRQSVWD